MTRHVFFITCALVLSLLCNGDRACSQELDRQEGPWRRDPFRYSASTQKDATLSKTIDSSSAQRGVDIRGILRPEDGRYYALANGRKVLAGDRVGDVRILSISRFSVVIEDMDGTRKIDLFRNQVKWGDQ